MLSRSRVAAILEPNLLATHLSHNGRPDPFRTQHILVIRQKITPLRRLKM